MRVHADGIPLCFCLLPLHLGGEVAFTAPTKVSGFNMCLGAILTQFLALILLVFAVTCESH